MAVETLNIIFSSSASFIALNQIELLIKGQSKPSVLLYLGLSEEGYINNALTPIESPSSYLNIQRNIAKWE